MSTDYNFKKLLCVCDNTNEAYVADDYKLNRFRDLETFPYCLSFREILTTIKTGLD